MYNIGKIEQTRQTDNERDNAMFKNFARKYNGKVISLDYCTRTNVWGDTETLPSCEGHAVIEVHEDYFFDAQDEAEQFTRKSRNFASIEVVSSDTRN